MIRLHDVVELLEDLPDANLHSGMQGAVIDVYDKPTLAYEVEFVNKEGDTTAQLTLLPSQVKLVWVAPHSQETH
ncbi:MAG TPA: DUF4926 domain-containing protein [Pyrinomonadaceae bacterium]|nr:DUF4926 domain-containing protein [Pyrinomonadaceae bacterium]